MRTVCRGLLSDNGGVHWCRDRCRIDGLVLNGLIDLRSCLRDWCNLVVLGGDGWGYFAFGFFSRGACDLFLATKEAAEDGTAFAALLFLGFRALGVRAFGLRLLGLLPIRILLVRCGDGSRCSWDISICPRNKFARLTGRNDGSTRFSSLWWLMGGVCISLPSFLLKLLLLLGELLVMLVFFLGYCFLIFLFFFGNTLIMFVVFFGNVAFILFLLFGNIVVMFLFDLFLGLLLFFCLFVLLVAEKAKDA